MAQVTITINNREYAVACEDGQEVRIFQLARLLDEKAKLITNGAGHVNENMLLAMIGLLVADELNELKKGNKATSAEPVDNSRILELDKTLAGNIKKLNEQIKSIASNLESL